MCIRFKSENSIRLEKSNQIENFGRKGKVGREQEGNFRSQQNLASRKKFATHTMALPCYLSPSSTWLEFDGHIVFTSQGIAGSSVWPLYLLSRGYHMVTFMAEKSPPVLYGLRPGETFVLPPSCCVYFRRATPYELWHIPSPPPLTKKAEPWEFAVKPHLSDNAPHIPATTVSGSHMIICHDSRSFL